MYYRKDSSFVSAVLDPEVMLSIDCLGRGQQKALPDKYARSPIMLNDGTVRRGDRGGINIKSKNTLY